MHAFFARSLRLAYGVRVGVALPRIRRTSELLADLLRQPVALRESMLSSLCDYATPMNLNLLLLGSSLALPLRCCYRVME